MIKQKIGLVGVGNMGGAILEGVLRKRITTPSRIWVYDKFSGKARSFARKTRVHIARDPRELCAKVDIVLLAMKPQDFKEFALKNKKFISKNSCVVSILAGLTTVKIKKELGEVTVIRAMPNLGAKVGESMTALCGAENKWLRVARELFDGCGETVVLPEKTFDAVTAVSGSGPAYFFYLMELMTNFGVKQKIPVKVAASLAIQTGIGAALLAKSSKLPCAELRRKVTSKKGTTEAALKTLAHRNFSGIFQSALAAAAKRSRQLRSR